MNDLVRELQELRAERDEPSLRDLAHLTGINRQSLSEALTGKRLPSWATVEKLVVALSGDLGKFRSLWEYQKMGYRSGGANFVSTEQEEVSCFISYSHIDDEKMAFADKLKSDLEYYAMANRGRKLTVFLDKESIKWGDEWQTSIRQSVLGATAFLPIVTFSYFQSSWCREELLLYYQNARSVGVTELILPIVVFGHSALSSNSDDEVARIISERQYKDLQSAFLEGPGSNEWRRALLDVANNLVDVVDSAERRLAPLEAVDASGLDLQERLAVGLNDESSGLSELSERAELLAGGLSDLSRRYVEEMNGVLAVLKRDFSHAGQEKWSSRTLTVLAAKVAPLANQAAQTGKLLESRAAEADSVVREALDLMELAGMTDARERLIDDFAKNAGSTNLAEVEQSIEQMSTSMMSAEVLSVSLRKALKPLRNSLRSVKSAATIFDSWRNLGA